MKQIKQIFLTIAVLMLLLPMTSCRRDVNRDVPVSNILVDASVVDNSAVEQSVSTRLNATAFEDGDVISFYAVKYVGGNAQILGADNYTYIKNQMFKRDNGLFKSFDGTTFTRQFFPNDGSAVDLYGIFPYHSTLPADFNAYKFKIKTNQSKADKGDYFGSDFLMSKRVNVAPTAVPNKMVFNHLLSRIIVNAKTENYLNNAKVASMRFLNISTGATIDLRAYDAATSIAGKVISDSDVANVVPFSEKKITAGYDTTFVAIVPPQTWAKEQVVMEFTLSDMSKQTFKLADQCHIEAGMESIFNIVVNFGEQYAINAGPVTIVPWGTTIFTGSAEQTSDDKFHVALTNKNVDVTSVTQVKIGVNGNRTYTLPLTKNAGAVSSDLHFEFRGVGNRPNVYPFNITSFEMLNVADVTIGTKEILSAPITIAAPALTELVYDMTAHTIVK